MSEVKSTYVYSDRLSLLFCNHTSFYFLKATSKSAAYSRCDWLNSSYGDLILPTEFEFGGMGISRRCEIGSIVPWGYFQEDSKSGIDPPLFLEIRRFAGGWLAVALGAVLWLVLLTSRIHSSVDDLNISLWKLSKLIHNFCIANVLLPSDLIETMTSVSVILKHVPTFDFDTLSSDQ
jgi:hypothetical protein